MKKIILIMSVISIISKLLGFGRDLSLAHFFGASEITDIFLISTAIPIVIFNFISLGLTSSFIPIYNELKEKQGEKESFLFTSNLLNFLIIVATIIAFFIFIFTQNIVKIFANGFNGETLETAIYYTRISIITIYFSAITSILSGLLQVNNKFYLVAMMGIPFNLIYISGIYIAYKLENIYLVFSVILAIFVQMLMTVYPLFKLKYKYKFILNLKDKYLKKLVILAIPVIISSGLEQINYLVDRTIASSVQKNGGITILNYSSRLNLAIIGIVVISIITVLFPNISTLIAKKDYNDLERKIKDTVSFIILFSVPMTIGLIFYSTEIVNLVFKRGNFTMANAKVTAICLRFYSLSFFAIALREVSLKILYALKDTKQVLYNSAIGIILNIILNTILSKYMGLSGIALATSISIIFTTILLSLSLNRYSFYKLSDIIIIFIKSFIASLIMLFFLQLIKIHVKFERIFFNLILAGIIGILIYGMTILFMKIEIVEKIKMNISKKISKR